MEGDRGAAEKLYKEMLSHIKETDESVPYPDSGWFYYQRTMEGSQYPIYARKAAVEGKLDESQPEQVLLDVNVLAEGQPYMAVGGMSVSPDGWLLAYSTDNTGFQAVHAAVSEFEDRRGAGGDDGAVGLVCVGGGWKDAVLYDRG